jgi:hypothetical protein
MNWKQTLVVAATILLGGIAIAGAQNAADAPAVAPAVAPPPGLSVAASSLYASGGGWNTYSHAYLISSDGRAWVCATSVDGAKIKSNCSMLSLEPARTAE